MKKERKNVRQPKKMEDDLKNKNGRLPKQK
jgi:hypothetical protein